MADLYKRFPDMEPDADTASRIKRGYIGSLTSRQEQEATQPVQQATTANTKMRIPNTSTQRFSGPIKG